MGSNQSIAFSQILLAIARILIYALMVFMKLRFLEKLDKKQPKPGTRGLMRIIKMEKINYDICNIDPEILMEAATAFKYWHQIEKESDNA